MNASRFFRRAAATLGLLFLSGGGCATVMPPCPERGGPAWWELTSDHFQIRTDVDPATAQQLTEYLEDTRAAMLALWWNGLAGPPGRMSVIVHRSTRTLESLAGRGTAGVWLRRSPFPSTMVISGATGSDGRRLLTHELAHALSNWFTPLQPRWYSEGLASYLESARYNRATSQAMVAVRVAVRHHDLLRTGLMKTSQILAITELPEGRAANSFEGSAWLLVQYLQERRYPDFRRLEAMLRELQPPQAAWTSVFGDLQAAQLDRDLYRYVAAGEFTGWVVPLKAPVATVQVRPMTDSEVHGVGAYLFGVVGSEKDPKWAAERAHEEVTEALRQDPASLEALAVRFYTSPELSDAQGMAIAQLAVESHPRRWFAWLMMADAAGLAAPAGVAALEKAAALAPDETEVLVRLTSLHAGRHEWSRALASASRALQLGAVRPPVLAVHLSALANNGDCATAARFASALQSVAGRSVAEEVADRWPAIKADCERIRAEKQRPAATTGSGPSEPASAAPP